jgi:hypothetical protein
MRPYRRYRQLTEADVGCHIFFKAFGRRWRANDYYQLAEGVGFEPTVPLQARRFSRPVP